MKNKILIIGSSGYLGTNLIKRLNVKKKIICFDKKKSRISPSDKKKIFKIYKADLNNKKKINEALKVTKIIFYRAGILGGPNSNKISKSRIYFKENIEKLIKFLVIAKKHKIEKFIYDSSFQIFDKKNNFNNEIQPFNYYGLSKITSEKILKNWCKENNVNLFIFRYPRIVCENSKNFLTKMVSDAKNYSKINLKKSFQKFRLVHIDDVLKANIEAIKSKSEGINIFNISIKKEYSLNDISKIIKLRLNSKIQIKKNKDISENFEPTEMNLNKNFFSLSKKFIPKIDLLRIISRQIEKKNEY